MLSAKRFIAILFAGLLLAGLAAGASSHIIRYAGPIEVVRVETMSSVDYLSVGRYASINAALADIGGSLPAGSSSNRYQIRIPPGEFDLGGSQIVMEEYVDIVGSGQNSTIITCACGGGGIGSGTATLVGADNAEARDLTVVNTGGGSFSTAIRNTGTSPAITNVTTSASGGTTNYGVHNSDSSSPTMTHVTASATGGENSIGVVNDLSSSPTMTNVTANGWDATIGSYGVYNGNSSAPVMMNVIANASSAAINYGIANYTSSPTMFNVSASAWDGTISYGVRNWTSSPIMTNVIASASDATSNIGVYNHTSASPIMTNVTVSASGGTNNYGMHNLGTSGTLTINRSSFSGATYSIVSSTAYTLNIGATLLDGSISKGGGTWTCAESYRVDYSGGVPPYPYQAVDSTCAAAGSLLPPAPDGGGEPAPVEPPPVGLPSPGE